MKFQGTQAQTNSDWVYLYKDAALYVSADGGTTWRLYMYFPKR